MRRNCRNCLCSTCLNTCCDRKQCKGKRKKCKRYSGFRQLGIFDPPQKPKRQKAPRHPWKYYGLENKNYRKKLKRMMQSEEYANIMHQAAYTAAPEIAWYIILATEKNLSYDGLQRLWDLKEIDRMACCRTDYYGYRREFYHYFDVGLRGGNGKKAK